MFVPSDRSPKRESCSLSGTPLYCIIIRTIAVDAVLNPSGSAEEQTGATSLTWDRGQPILSYQSFTQTRTYEDVSESKPASFKIRDRISTDPPGNLTSGNMPSICASKEISLADIYILVRQIPHHSNLVSQTVSRSLDGKRRKFTELGLC